MITDKILNVLEFDKVKERLSAYLTLPMSYGLLSEPPSHIFEEAQARLSFTKEADRVISNFNIDPIVYFDSVDGIILKTQKESMLSIPEIMKIGALLRSSRIFKSRVMDIADEHIPALKETAVDIYADKNLEEEISRCFLSEDMVSDGASAKLADVRRRIRKCNDDIKDKLNSIIRSSEYQRFIQDSIVTVRSGRYVVPVKQEYKNNVQGMLHDRSDTGATVYIEPAAVVQLNNELRLLHLQEAEEIERILRDFTFQISLIGECLNQNVRVLSAADVAFAKAKFAHVTKSICPELNSAGKIDIINGRHPLISPEKIVPITVSLGKSYSLLVITGPNTGGKTVTLKLCGLFCIMAMSGMYLPASDGTSVSVFDNIFADIGDEQSIENSLSTFSSHIKNIVNIVDNTDERTLVLLDELGVGTDPAEGAALALSVLEFLSEKKAKGIITTHYSEVKEYAFLSDTVMNASMEFDTVRLTPTYRLTIGSPGSSNALEISKKLGLNQDIINRAYSHLSDEKIAFENILRSAERARVEAEQLKAEAEQLKEKYELIVSETDAERQKIKELRESISKNSKAEAKRIYSAAAEESGRLIDELAEIVRQSEISEYDLVRAKQIKNALEGKKYQSESDGEYDEKKLFAVNAAELMPGDRVYVKALNGGGIVKSVSKNKKEAEIDMGNMTLSFKTAELFCDDRKPKLTKKATNNPSNKSNAPGVSVTRQLQGAPPQREIMLLGKTVLEAVPEVENFIDACFVSGIKECKIIHGTGTGALRKAVWQHLKSDSHVQQYRSGRYGEGERGVTIVTLK